MISTKPKTERESAALARARQLTDFVWTPLKDIPCYSRVDGQTVIPAGQEVTGFIYASCETNDRFLAENVSFESFITAIPNPYSKLYQPGHAALFACNFGIVCNSFVRYALGILPRVPTKHWLSIDGMRLIAKKGEYTAEDIKLLDVLHAFNDGRNHVSLITDIIKDENGKILYIEVSEAVRPCCKREKYTPEEYFEKYKVFALCRYDKLEEVPLLDEDIEQLVFQSGLQNKKPKIAIDNGNKSNYRVGDEVVVSVFLEGTDTVTLYKDGIIFENYKVTNTAVFPLSLPKGYYVATLENAKESVEFCVFDDEVSFTTDENKISICANPCDESAALSMIDFRAESGSISGLTDELTEEENKSGKITREIPKDTKSFKVYYKNRYGVFTRGKINL